MKKVLIILGFVGLLALTGCFHQPTTEETEPITDTADQTQNQNNDTTATPTPKPRERSIIAFYEPMAWPAGEVLKGRGEAFLREEWLSLQEGQEPKQIDEESIQTYIQDIINVTQFWKAGTFQSGVYAGQTLVIEDTGDCLGPCPNHLYRFAVDLADDRWTLLEKYSYKPADTDELPFNYTTVVHRPVDSVDDTLTIAEFEVPEELPIYPNSKVVLSEKESMMDPTIQMGPEIGLTGPEPVGYTGGPFSSYFYLSNCIYGVMPDGVTAKYAVVPDEFVVAPTSENPHPFAIEKELTFTDLAGKSETKTYTIESGGCGIGLVGCPVLYTPASNEDADLVNVGTLGNEDAYAFVTISGEGVLSMKEAVRRTYEGYVMRREYDDTLKNEKLLSLEEFLKQNKVLFLKLDNQKYLAVFEKGYNQPAECGKPVIYLYPEETTLVNVQVGVDQFTKTIPAYAENGWTVLAEPSGTLYNPSDKQEYPYLFWEGTSNKQLSSLTPWTTKKNEVSVALPKVLHDLGLRGREISDFMEFWGPRILAEKAPYIEFSFVAQKVFDEIAPLTITPKPDTVLRVFMIYRGTNQAGFAAPRYASLPRNGFTVVEWGGALH